MEGSGLLHAIGEMMKSVLGPVNNVVWGPCMLVLLLGTGLYLTFGLRFLTFRKIPSGFGSAAAGGTVSKGNFLRSMR